MRNFKDIIIEKLKVTSILGDELSFQIYKIIEMN